MCSLPLSVFLNGIATRRSRTKWESGLLGLWISRDRNCKKAVEIPKNNILLF